MRNSAAAAGVKIACDHKATVKEASSGGSSGVGGSWRRAGLGSATKTAASHATLIRQPIYT